MEAQALWYDSHRALIEAKASGEKRFILIAKIKTKLWTAIYTLRNKRIRIISVRRARKEEVLIYES